MKNKILSYIIILSALFFLPAGIYAEEAGKKILNLQSYEPNTLGMTWDDNDVEYMDFKISLKYPILHDGEYPKEIYWYRPFPYLAFTGRFGQYFKTRQSSPVMGKRFNPKLFVKWWLKNKENYIEAGYAHESNGQSISDKISYQFIRDYLSIRNENPDFANDYLSRGWDYWDLIWKYSNKYKKIKISTYLNLKYFLNNSYPQGRLEEYYDWENGGEAGKPRKSVDGITIMAVFSKIGSISGQKVTLMNTTGYRKAFKYNTNRFEFTVNYRNTPVMFWVSNGYNSDLVDYYKRVLSYGLAFELRSLLDED